MDFVNADRASLQILLRPRLHPIVVAPLVAIQIVNQVRRFFAVLAEEPERIGLQKQRAPRRADLECVMRSFPHSRQQHFPNAAGHKLPRWSDRAMPSIETTP